ncbi:MAG: ThiF family adenylyltransferase [Candidatus Aenigmarchaeota archaeon]|nr:ThiF family adenylyltransferase [Candidatus Aenigmarchaeota archaeon]
MENRYSRQIRYIGEYAQDRVSKSKVCIIGCGALGSASAELLTRAGVGTIKLVDRDFLELSNLQRQHVFSEEDINKPKALALAERLGKINSSIEIEPLVEDFNSSKAESIVKGFDIVIDGLDNMHSRFILNEACVKLNMPWVYGSAIRNMGHTSFIDVNMNCLNCFIKTLPSETETCETSGVTNSITSLISAIQVNETLKYLGNQKYTLLRLFLYIDLEHMIMKSFGVSKDPDCRVCSLKKFDFLEKKESSWITSLCGKNSYHFSPPSKIGLDLQGARARIPQEFSVSAENKSLVRAHSGDKEITVFNDGRMITKNIEKNEAETVCKKIVLI